MYTSANENRRLDASRTVRNYVLATCFAALFGAVYEHFSFGVWSVYMVFAFAAPLVLGVLPWAANAARPVPTLPPRSVRQLWNAGAAVLTVGCLFRGVLDIYGTSSALGTVYWIAGPALLAVSLVSFLGRRARAAA